MDGIHRANLKSWHVTLAGPKRVWMMGEECRIARSVTEREVKSSILAFNPSLFLIQPGD